MRVAATLVGAALAALSLPALAQHRGRRDHVRVECPVAVDDPGLVLARVRATTLTACDVAIAMTQRVRTGLCADDPRAVLRELVDEALLAASEEPPTHDPGVDRALAEALVRAETLRALEGRRPSTDEVERYLSEHPESFVREARVHLRQLVFASEADAREAIRTLASGTRFEELLPRSIDPLAARDGGDLGMLTVDGADAVPQGVVRAGFSLAEPGSVAPEPVASTRLVRPPREHGRRRPRAQPAAIWHVVQLVERIPEERPPDEERRRRAADRILRERYAAARAGVRARLAETFGAQARAAVVDEALRQVRIAPSRP